MGESHDGGHASGRALSARELEVLAAMARGHSNREIAEQLGIAPKTAMHHTEAIYLKLGVSGRVQAVATAVRDGLVDPDPRP